MLCKLYITQYESCNTLGDLHHLHTHWLKTQLWEVHNLHEGCTCGNWKNISVTHKLRSCHNHLHETIVSAATATALVAADKWPVSRCTDTVAAPGSTAIFWYEVLRKPNVIQTSNDRGRLLLPWESTSKHDKNGGNPFNPVWAWLCYIQIHDL